MWYLSLQFLWFQVLSAVAVIWRHYLLSNHLEFSVNFQVLRIFYLFVHLTHLFIKSLMHSSQFLSTVFLEILLFLSLNESIVSGQVRVGIFIDRTAFGSHMSVKFKIVRLIDYFLAILWSGWFRFEDLWFSGRRWYIFIIFRRRSFRFFINLFLHIFLYPSFQLHILFLLFLFLLSFPSFILFHLHSELLLILLLFPGSSLNFIRIGNKQSATVGLITSCWYF